MDRGWTKSWRKRWDSDLASYPYANHIFQYLIDKAAYKKTTTSFRYQCVQLEKGDVLIGRDSLSANTGVSRRSVRTCLNYLKSTNRIAIRTTNRYSIVSILKWDIYQGDDNANDQQNGQQDDQQATSKRPASDHIEEVKKLKKERKTNVSARYEYPADFMEFWSIYPRRENKTQARKEWEFEKAHNPKFAQEKILQAARTYADETNGRDRDRIKMPSTFLHAGTWLEKVYIEEATA